MMFQEVDCMPQADNSLIAKIKLLHHLQTSGELRAQSILEDCISELEG